MAKQKKVKSSKSSASVPVASGNTFTEGVSKVYELLSKNGFLFFSVCISLLIVFVFRHFLFLEQVYLFKDIGSDSVNGFLPQPVHLSDYIRQEGLPRWSFNVGMGQNILGFSLGDPFMLVFIALNKSNIPFAMAYVEAVKLFLSGSFFYLFLRILKIGVVPAIAGGLMYAFSGFMMVGSGWYTFSLEGLYFAFLLFSIEQFLSKNRWFLFPLAVALIGASQPFNLYLSGILTFGYVVVRTTYFSISTAKQNFMSLLVALLKLGGLGIIGVGISGFFLLSNLEQILQSPRGTGESSYFNILSSKPVFAFAEPSQYMSLLMREFNSDMIGTGNEFKGWTNYLESPLGYCGVICFLLVPVFFSTVKRKQKIILGIVFSACVIPLIFPYFRYIFWLFSGDYFRAFSLFEILVFLLMAVGGLHLAERSGKLNGFVISAGLLFALMILYIPYHDRDAIINNDLRWSVSVLLFLYSGILYLINSASYRKTAQLLLVLLVMIELGSFSSAPFEKRKTINAKELTEKTGYNDYSNEAIAFLHQRDSSFYRVIKDYSSGPAMHGSLNDAKIQGFYGTASYNSFPQKYYIEFFQKMGITHAGNEIEARWVPGLLSRPLLQPLANVKYLLSKRTDYNPLSMGYDSLTKTGDVRVYQNKYFLPLGVTYETAIPENEFLPLSQNTKDAVILRACVVQNESDMDKLNKFNQKDSTVMLTFEFFKASTDSLRKNSLEITKRTQNTISGTIQLEKKKMLFLAIPFDNGWKATVDGNQADLLHCNIGFMGLMLDKGTHKIELNFQPPYLRSGMWISIVSILVFLGLIVVMKKKPGAL